jgi:tetratricopeptide (TPR) repeat protein/predicted Ser/Thr protein kinase
MVGTTIGAYRITSQLGAGGMGVVYKAFDGRLQRHVALKVLPSAVSADEGRRRLFLREARAASALNDSHIVTIHDIFEHEGTDVLVMELVEGRTLREAMSKPVPIPQALEWARQMADALGAAHGAGIVHRDLKPGNVMITERGHVKVLDFGLAKVPATGNEMTRAPETRSGDVFGTLEYMSPEQARGKPVDHRSDIYALGTILYEMIVGRRPFAAENRLALLQEIAHSTPPPLRSVRPDVSEVLDDLVSRALAREPQMRFQSMWELSAALKFAATFTAGVMPAVVADRAGAPASSVGAVAQPPSSVAAGPVAQPASVAASALPVAGGAFRWLIAAGAMLGAVAVVMTIGLRLWSSRPVPAAPPEAASTPAAAAQPGTPVELTQQGLVLIRRFDLAGNVDKGIASFEAAIAKDKASAPAWAGLARAYWRKQTEARDVSWGARALDAATQAVTLDPFFANAHVSLGLAKFAGGDTDAARQAFDRALVLDPSNAGAHRGLGALDKAAGRPAEAAAHFDQALVSDPTDWELMWLHGEIAYQSARYDAALKWYARATQAAPDSPVPYRLIGAAHHMLGDYGAAAAAFQQSLSLQPTAAGYANLGTALFFHGRYRDSVQAFERAVELQPGNPLHWGNLGDAYRFVPGNAEKAADAYGRAIQLLREQLANDPSQPINRSRLALHLAKSGDTTTALTELAKVLTPDVGEVNTLYRATVTYELAGKRDEALATLEQALERGYGIIEVRADPELARLRTDVRYHRIVARFERAVPK